MTLDTTNAATAHVRPTPNTSAPSPLPRRTDRGLATAVLRAEMASRERLPGDLHGSPAANQIAPDYRFETGTPVETEIYVERGLAAAPQRTPIIPDSASRSPHFVFTDARVHGLHAGRFVTALRRLGYDVRTVLIPEGERAKSLATYGRCVEAVLAAGIDERSVLIAFGGGVVCNLTGFVASTLYRGVGLVHVPTTLMAQCDAAISHKQAVNGNRGKNLVGSYYAPSAIAVDVDVLGTLRDDQVADGLAEVLKHALAQDETYISALEAHGDAGWDLGFLESVVRRNIHLKCELMRRDPREQREGMVLQYGHTVGHPIEYLSGFSLSHGQAVAIGMMVAARVSMLLGACEADTVERHRHLIEQFGLPTRIPGNVHPEDIMGALRYNKRYLTEGTRMALVDRPGRLWSVDGEYALPVPDAVLRGAVTASY